jgi:hypothetical protein
VQKLATFACKSVQKLAHEILCENRRKLACAIACQDWQTWRAVMCKYCECCAKFDCLCAKEWIIFSSRLMCNYHNYRAILYTNWRYLHVILCKILAKLSCSSVQKLAHAIMWKIGVNWLVQLRAREISAQKLANLACSYVQILRVLCKIGKFLCKQILCKQIFPHV